METPDPDPQWKLPNPHRATAKTFMTQWTPSTRGHSEDLLALGNGGDPLTLGHSEDPKLWAIVDTPMILNLETP